jgi:excisionase family DNA binding protein
MTIGRQTHQRGDEQVDPEIAGVRPAGSIEPLGYTVDDAARRLDCYPKTIRNMINAGRLKIYRVGKVGLRVTKQSIEDLVNGVGQAPAKSRRR